MRITSVVAVVILLCTTSMPAKAQNYGRFEGNVETTWPVHKRRDMVLLQDFVYVGPDGQRWLAPRGATVDGASIPSVFWVVVGDPYDGEYRRASVVHDVACDEKKRPWKDVHRMFYTAMLADGVSMPKAKLMYTAVYMGGPRWELRTSPLIAASSAPAVASRMLREAGPDYEVSEISVSTAAAGTEEAEGAEGGTRVTVVLEVRNEEPSKQDVESVQARIAANPSLSLDQLEALADQLEAGGP